MRSPLRQLKRSINPKSLRKEILTFKKTLSAGQFQKPQLQSVLISFICSHLRLLLHLQCVIYMFLSRLICTHLLPGPRLEIFLPICKVSKR